MPGESKFWVFTLNNPSEDEEQSVTDFLSSGNVSYGIFGRETGESGTPHFQGYVILDRSRRLTYLRRHFSDRAHFERRRGSHEEARDYCKKDGDFEEFGEEPASSQGKRTDLDALFEWADQFVNENGRPPTPRELARDQPEAYVKFPRLLECIRLRCPQPVIQDGELNEWQQELEDRLLQPADDRTIDFVIDEEGGKGKTFFTRYMISKHDGVQILGIGKKQDISYMLDESKHIFLFNVPRGQMEYLSYALLEALKDRMVISTKYQGRLKVWYTQPHVVVLTNELPDMEKLTADRYNLITLV